MKKPCFGVGIVGFGFIGRMHAFAVHTLPFFYPGMPFAAKLVGICSRRQETVDQAMAELPFEFGTTDFDALLEREDIQVISICTPNDQHEDMVLRALAAGKHVYCDKPIAVTYEQAARMAEAEAQSGISCQMTFNNRFFPATMRAKELVEEGAIGDIIGVRAQYLLSSNVNPDKKVNWKASRDNGGGILLDLGAHALDLATWLAGPVKRVSARTRALYAKRPSNVGGTWENPAEDQAIVMFELENGALGVMEASKIATGAADDLTIEISGTKGAVRFVASTPALLYYFDQSQPEGPLGKCRGWQAIHCGQRYPAPGGVFVPANNAIGWDRAHVHCYYSFLESLALGRKPSPSLAEGAYNQRIMQAAYTSSENGQWVDV